MIGNLSKPLVYLITKGASTTENFSKSRIQILEIVRRAADAEISLIQIREKNLSGRMLFELAAEAAEIVKKTTTKLLINDRADIALAANADGVHLTARSLSAAIIRREFPENFIVGVSAHSFESAALAAEQKADFAVFSPVFDSPGKGEPLGSERLLEVCKRLKPFPIIALGGIDDTNYRKVLDCGASGFAAIRFLNGETNLRKFCKNLRSN